MPQRKPSRFSDFKKSLDYLLFGEPEDDSEETRDRNFRPRSPSRGPGERFRSPTTPRGGHTAQTQPPMGPSREDRAWDDWDQTYDRTKQEKRLKKISLFGRKITIEKEDKEEKEGKERKCSRRDSGSRKDSRSSKGHLLSPRQSGEETPERRKEAVTSPRRQNEDRRSSDRRRDSQQNSGNRASNQHVNEVGPPVPPKWTGEIRNGNQRPRPAVSAPERLLVYSRHPEDGPRAQRQAERERVEREESAARKREYDKTVRDVEMMKRADMEYRTKENARKVAAEIAAERMRKEIAEDDARRRQARLAREKAAKEAKETQDKKDMERRVKWEAEQKLKKDEQEMKDREKKAQREKEEKEKRDAEARAKEEKRLRQQAAINAYQQARSQPDAVIQGGNPRQRANSTPVARAPPVAPLTRDNVEELDDGFENDGAPSTYLHRGIGDMTRTYIEGMELEQSEEQRLEEEKVKKREEEKRQRDEERRRRR